MKTKTSSKILAMLLSMVMLISCMTITTLADTDTATITVTDGSGNDVTGTYATLQDALTAAQDGYTISISAGTFTVTGDAAVEIANKNVTLTGAGQDATTLKFESSVITDNDRIRVTGDNVTIQDMTIDATDVTKCYGITVGKGGKYDYTINSFTMENVTVKVNSSTLGAVYIGNGDYTGTFTIDNCTIDGSPIIVASADVQDAEFIFTNNTIKNSLWHGISIFEAGSAPYTTSNITATITGNTFVDCGSTTYADFAAIDIYSVFESETTLNGTAITDMTVDDVLAVSAANNDGSVRANGISCIDNADWFVKAVNGTSKNCTDDETIVLLADIDISDADSALDFTSIDEVYLNGYALTVSSETIAKSITTTEESTIIAEEDGTYNICATSVILQETLAEIEATLANAVLEIDQADANTSADVSALVEDLVEELILDNIDFDGSLYLEVEEITNFVAAADGNDGSFDYSILINLDYLAGDSYDSTGVIVATEVAVEDETETETETEAEAEVLAEGTADMAITLADDTLESVFTADELALIEEGVDLKVVLTADAVEIEDLHEDEQTLITETVAALADNAVFGFVLDLSLSKFIGDDETAITDLDGKVITVTIDVPEEYLADGRTFSVIRIHDGEVTVLDDLDDDDTTITFETGLFSTYAVSYTDEVAEEEVETEDADGVETGDSTTALPIALGVIAMAGMVVLFKKRSLAK